MNNVTKVIDEPPPKPKIGDMEPGENGYTIPWAYNKDLRRLDESAEIVPNKFKSSTLFVTCVEKGKYEIKFT